MAYAIWVLQDKNALWLRVPTQDAWYRATPFGLMEAQNRADQAHAQAERDKIRSARRVYCPSS